MNVDQSQVTTNSTKDLTATEMGIIADEVKYTVDINMGKPIINSFKLEAKFIVSVLTPAMDMDKKVDETAKPQSVRVQNKTVGASLSSSVTTRSNQMTLPIPFNIASNFISDISFTNSKDIKVTENIRGAEAHIHNAKILSGTEFKVKTLTLTIVIPKNTEFLIGFIGNDPNKARVIGINGKKGV